MNRDAGQNPTRPAVALFFTASGNSYFWRTGAADSSRREEALTFSFVPEEI